MLTRDAFTQPRRARAPHTRVRAGRPLALDGKALAPVALIEQLEALAAPFGIGRGIHLGDTIIGTKGRVAFEAPAAETLLTAHRELEKLVLTARQQRIKELRRPALRRPRARGTAARSGMPRHRGAAAVLAAARHGRRARAVATAASLFIEGVESPYSLMAASKGVYGESVGEWSPADALGFSKIVALPGVFFTARRRACSKEQ